MSYDSKILQKGYTNAPYGTVRAKVNTAWKKDQAEIEHPPRSIKKYPCKKTKGNHNWVLVPPNGEPKAGQTKAQYEANLFQPKRLSEKYTNLFSLSKGAKVFVCSGCGKLDIRWNH